MVLITGLMAINAAIYGNPNEVWSGEQFVISGILSALIMFPIYCFLMFMFTGRPMPVKKRMIKKRYAGKEIDMIRKERDRLEAQSSLKPPTSLPVGGMGPGAPVQPGATSLLALPPPIPLGGGQHGGMLALPMGPGGGMRPPAPRYPPPGPGKALPPAPQDLLPPIYFGRAGAPALPALPSYNKAKPPMPPGAFGQSGPYGLGTTGGSSPPPALAGMKPMTPRSAKPPAPPPALPPPGGMSTPGSGRRGGTPPGMPTWAAPRGPPRPPAGGAPPPPPPGAAGAPRPPVTGPAPPPPMEGRHNAPIPDWEALTGSSNGQAECGNSVSSTVSAHQEVNLAVDQSYRLLIAGRLVESRSSWMLPENYMTARKIDASACNSPRTSEADSSRSSVIDREEGIEDVEWIIWRDGAHRMQPPPPPPPGGMVKKAPGARPPNLNFSGTGPLHGTQGAMEPKTPTLPPPSTRGFMPATPKGMPPVIPFGVRPDNIIGRGQPPPNFPPPFKVPPPSGPGLGSGPPGMELALLGSSPSPMSGPLTTPSPLGGAPGGPIAPGVPLPPPPPREDDSAFVRRVRLIYMDRVMREHQKQELLEMEAVDKPIPNFIFNVWAVLPYIACSTFIIFSIVIILVYAMKFDTWQEEHWLSAVVTGFLTVVFILDVIRSAIYTIVELRKYEIRKRSKAGDFVVRKVNKMDDSESLPALLRPKPKTRAKATPPVPKTAPKFNDMNRPKFLPDVQKSSPGPLPPPPPAQALPSGNTPRSGQRTPPGGFRSPRSNPGFGQPPPGQRTPPGMSPQGMASRSGPPSSRSAGSYRTGGAPPPPPPGAGTNRAQARANSNSRS